MVGRGWIIGESIEETLELWAASLREVKARMRPLFTQKRVAASAGLFLDGLLGDVMAPSGIRFERQEECPCMVEGPRPGFILPDAAPSGRSMQ